MTRDEDDEVNVAKLTPATLLALPLALLLLVLLLLALFVLVAKFVQLLFEFEFRLKLFGGATTAPLTREPVRLFADVRTTDAAVEFVV